MSALGDIGFSSPGSFARIMSLYTGGSLANKQSRPKTQTMREAINLNEGLKLGSLDDSAVVAKLQSSTWDDIVSTEQNTAQLNEVRFNDDLRPIPFVLRTKRSKRCPICRHIISKPEAKVGNPRFRIRLVAASYIPSISIKPLKASPPAPSTMVPPTPKFNSPADTLLQPLVPVQYILTFKNPIFETVKVTLATQSTTPGRFASKVTVLCPQFEIDANTDMWDDALKVDNKEKRRRKGEEGGLHQVVAGKPWDRGRNWVSIVLEVIPSTLRLDTLELMAKGNETTDTSSLKEDEDVLEIPMFVRLEWEADAQHDVGTGPGKEKDAREKRELAYWCVLGIGRISQD
jgi:dynactin 4